MDDTRFFPPCKMILLLGYSSLLVFAIRPAVPLLDEHNGKGLSRG